MSTKIEQQFRQEVSRINLAQLRIVRAVLKAIKARRKGGNVNK